MNLTKRQYHRALELFAIVHEEIGEAQKSFNNYAWKDKGTRLDILAELSQVDSPLQELQRLLSK